jgi:hypothetical protein
MNEKNLDLYLSPFIRPALSVKDTEKIDRYSVNRGGTRATSTSGFAFVGSAQVVKRRVFPEVGDWKPASALRSVSSFDFVYRSWAMGANIGVGEKPTVVVIPSTRYGLSYQGDKSWIHREAADYFLAKQTEALNQTGRISGHRAEDATTFSKVRLREKLRGFSAKFFLVSRAVSLLAPMSQRFGLSRAELRGWLLRGQLGARDVSLRRRRGLPARGIKT